jgi:hypothetical protein
MPHLPETSSRTARFIARAVLAVRFAGRGLEWLERRYEPVYNLRSVVCGAGADPDAGLVCRGRRRADGCRASFAGAARVGVCGRGAGCGGDGAGEPGLGVPSVASAHVCARTRSAGGYAADLDGLHRGGGDAAAASAVPSATAPGGPSRSPAGTREQRVMGQRLGVAPAAAFCRMYNVLEPSQHDL